MVVYAEKFVFRNDVGTFNVIARTEEHPSDYGNGTMLVLDIESDFPYPRRKLFDVRYEGYNMPDITRLILKQEFGVDF